MDTELVFRLDNTIKVDSLNGFVDLINHKDEIESYEYAPDILEPSAHPRLKIAQKKFSKVSFSKTTLQKIDFRNCHFEKCLFIGAKIIDCEFHNCSFILSNFHKVEISKTYIDPSSLASNCKSLKSSNIMVHLFQVLLNNAKDEDQATFARIASYNFQKWQGHLICNKYLNEKPQKISFVEFLKGYAPNFILRWVFGYGLRIRNFIITFTVSILLFFILNSYLWKDYVLTFKDVSNSYMNLSSFDLLSVLMYTLDATTKLVDSQLYPCSETGIIFLSIQGAVGFILLSFLITVLLNRFVK